MKCHICDNDMKDSEVQIDPKTGKIRACPTCWEIINDTLSYWKEPEEPEETDFPEIGDTVDFGWDVVSPQVDEDELE